VRIDRIDHIVLFVADVERTIEVYTSVLGMEAVTFGEGRRALRFGQSKINLHQVGREPEPRPGSPTPGAGDFCLITETPVEELVAHLEACGVPIDEGPSPRTGATGTILSVYFHDPDGNLVEVSNYRS
jgi:catechol 2,3-dioxygenase-like lactoylglutathione lyase family enzyme